MGKTEKQRQAELGKVYQDSSLALGRLSEILVGPDTLDALNWENINASDSELCQQRIQDIKDEEQAKKPLDEIQKVKKIQELSDAVKEIFEMDFPHSGDLDGVLEARIKTNFTF